MYELPEHLSSLNALAPSPSSMPVLDTSAEDAVWHYLNTDELFRNFGVQPSEVSSKETVPKESPKTTPPADLKSFIEQFASENAVSGPSTSFDFSTLNMASLSSAPTPIGVSTADIMPQQTVSTPWESSPDDDRPSGAKKLKSIGAGVAEIEEDKRRRNTEASARFRAKKKEREQNLEKRAKELEGQVAQLTAEKASLENENRLLKAIVLGGNGQSAGASSTEALTQLMGKRKRD